MLTVLLPWMKELMEPTTGDQKGHFWYQYPPTLRVQPGRSLEFLGSNGFFWPSYFCEFWDFSMVWLWPFTSCLRWSSLNNVSCPSCHRVCLLPAAVALSPFMWPLTSPSCFRVWHCIFFVLCRCLPSLSSSRFLLLFCDCNKDKGDQQLKDDVHSPFFGLAIRFKRPHRDAEYGHQIGELNCWMPLTDSWNHFLTGCFFFFFFSFFNTPAAQSSRILI